MTERTLQERLRAPKCLGNITGAGGYLVHNRLDLEAADALDAKSALLAEAEKRHHERSLELRQAYIALAEAKMALEEAQAVIDADDCVETYQRISVVLTKLKTNGKEQKEVERREVYDPFLNQTVKIDYNLCDRLEGKYACGPTGSDGLPEFGYNQYQTPPIQHEAAKRIRELRTTLTEVSTVLDEAHCFLSAAGINLLTASLIIKKLGGSDEVVVINQAHDQILAGIDRIVAFKASALIKST